MQLSKRLQAIADLVTEGNRVVDVGCDHGYLPVYLAQTGKIPSAIAMDINEGPLKRAEENIRRNGLEDRISVRLSDGLKALSGGEGDTLVIAGMGGLLMEHILGDRPETVRGFRELILQPQSDLPHFRRFLHHAGCRILEEEIVLEDGKFYPMMKAVPAQAGKPEEAWKPEEYAYGKLLLDRRHPVLLMYLQRENRILENIEKSLLRSSGEKGAERMAEIEEERRILTAAFERYESR